MAIRPKNQVGTIPCLCCGQVVPVKETESGTLNFACPWCDFPAYAKAGTEANRRVRKAMRPLAAPVDSPPPPADTKPVPANPEPSRPRTIFG